MDTRDYSTYRCYKCNTLGHCSANCKASKAVIQSVKLQYKKAAKCTKCLQLGHYVTECDTPKCSLCYKTGHITANCKEDKCECYKCHNIGHYPSKCPNDDKLKNITCYKCKRLGHYANNCTTMICTNCGGTDHLSKVCPEERLCYKCHMPGHYASKCEITVIDEEITSNQEAMLNLGNGGDTTDSTVILSDEDDEDDNWLGKSLLKVETATDKIKELKKLKRNNKDTRKRKYNAVLDAFVKNKKPYTNV